MKITIPVAVEAPTPAQVENWFTRHGWQEESRTGGFIDYAGPQAVIGIPSRTDSRDYPRLLTIALLDVAEIVGIEPADLVAQMREER